jgi:hypothetical protein
LTTALCLAPLPVGVTAFADDMPMPINADQVKWGPAPPNIPPGAQLAVIAGNPAAEGQPYVIRLKMPTNYKIPAHYHPVAESVTVISGNSLSAWATNSTRRKGWHCIRVALPTRLRGCTTMAGPTGKLSCK